MMECTILMPCLNEARSLEFCIHEAQLGLMKLGLTPGVDAEILIADNGSTDGSRAIAEANGARVVTVPERGYGAALLGGIRAACGKYIIMGDADGSYDFSELEKFWQALQSGTELVVGDRFAGGIEPGAMPLLHRIGVPALSALARWRFHAPVHDFHCGLRGFDRQAALELNLHYTGMEFATEIIAAFALSGKSICQVPTSLRRDRRDGKSHLRTFRDGWRHLKYIVSYRQQKTE